MVNYFRSFMYLKNLLNRSYWDREKLSEYRNDKLKKIIMYSYQNVPYYYQLFKKLNIRPEEIKKVSDLNKIPIMNKNTVRVNLNQMVSKSFLVDDLSLHRTSGSTGEPLYFYLSQSEDEYRKAKHIRALMSCGQKPFDKWVLITHPLYFRQSTRLQKLFRFFTPLSVSVFDDVATQIATIEKLRPDVLDGYASSLLLLAKELNEIDKTSISPRLLISGADLISSNSRTFVEKVFEAPFFDQYGCAELERLASQCSEKSGYHIDADSVVMQFVDEDGEEVAPGESGEVVCTSLFNYAMPFIRYAVGDIGSASYDYDCACGRTLPLMEMIEGRTDSIIYFPDGRAISSFAFIAAFYQLNFYSKIQKFRVIQKKIDEFKVLIQVKEEIDENLARNEILNKFQLLFNLEVDSINFDIEFVDYMPIDKSGKFRMIISEISNDVDKILKKVN